ncbi:MAG: transporter substrate-binding domain-containing protein [Anaerolineales bacterium]
MKKLHAVYIVFILASLVLTAFVVPGQVVAGPQSTGEKQGRGGECLGTAEDAIVDLDCREVTIAIENAYLPFNYIDEATGEAGGWDYDAWEEICTRLHCTPVFVEAAWEGMIQAVADGQYDAAADGITITPDRDEIVDFSVGYVAIEQRLLVRIDETRINSIEDIVNSAPSGAISVNQILIAAVIAVLAIAAILFAERYVAASSRGMFRWVGVALVLIVLVGYSVWPRQSCPTLALGTQTGTTNYETASQYLPAACIQAFEQFPFAVQALIAGDIDAVIIDETAGQGYLGANAEDLKLVGPSLSSDQLGFIFPPGSNLIDPVNQALESMMDDGRLNELNAIYFGSDFNCDYTDTGITCGS